MNLNSSFPDTKMYKDQKIMISKLSVLDVIFHSRVYEKVANTFQSLCSCF